MNFIKNKSLQFSYFWKCSLFVTLWLIFLTSCSNDAPINYSAGMPQAMGKTSEIVVVADDDVWEGPAGDTFQFYFESSYLILPQPEPIFDLRHITPERLNGEPTFRELRTYVFLANISDLESATTKLIRQDIGQEKFDRAMTDPSFHTVVGHNKWARGQMLTFIFAKSHDQLAENIKASFPSITKRVHDFDQTQIGNRAYFTGRNQAMEKLIKEKMNADMKIPKEYFLAIDENNTIWLRKETGKLSANIFVHKLPYTSADQFSKVGMRTIRDTLGKRYVTTDTQGSYMKTNDQDLPMFMNTMDLHGNYAVEARGIWDVEGDFMGGPFLGYLIHDKVSEQLLYVEGFVHAPRTTKRKHMEQLEHILRHTKFGGEASAAAVEK